MSVQRSASPAGDLRFLRFRDGFFLSLAMLEREHQELLRLIAKLTREDPTEALHGIAVSWRIVDVVHRIRELAEGLPGLGTDPRRRTFLQETAIAEQFRHYVQHLREEFAKREFDPSPVWGSFSWVDGNDPETCHTALSGTILRGAVFGSCVYDRLEKRWVSRASLSIRGITFNIDPMVEATAAFCRYALAYIERDRQLPPANAVNAISVRATPPAAPGPNESSGSELDPPESGG